MLVGSETHRLRGVESRPEGGIGWRFVNSLACFTTVSISKYLDSKGGAFDVKGGGLLRR